MQLVSSFFIGILVGIIGTIPLGPISIYVAQRAVEGEVSKGVHVGVGSVIVDIVYCLIITLGLMTIVQPYMENTVVQLSLSAIIIVYGLKMLLVDSRKPPKPAPPIKRTRESLENRHFYVLLGATLALANPTLFFSWTGVIGFLTLHKLVSTHFWENVVLSFAIGGGSLLWFWGLAWLVARKRHSFPKSVIHRAGVVTALVIIGFGVYFSVTIVQRILS